MKHHCLAILIVLLMLSCKSKKAPLASSKTAKIEVSASKAPSKLVSDIIRYAETFKGTRYKYGGTNRRGMDCSGLIYTSFKKHDIPVPRTTRDLKSYGKWVDVKTVIPGDLLFFATRKNSRAVNHVGLVTQVRPGYVEFIHASTSKGVMVSSLSDRYWYFAYVQARRIL